MARLPWRLGKPVTEAVSGWNYWSNRFANFSRPQCSDGKFKILICVPFYGYTGGAFTVLSVANLLSETCDVSFLTIPSNVMNKYVSRKVRMVRRIAAKYVFCVIESGTDDAVVAKVKRDGARIILAMHGAPSAADGTKNHGYTDQQVASSVRSADSVQYTSRDATALS